MERSALTMTFPLEVLQNLLMGIRPVARFAQKFHSTGLNAKVEEIDRLYDFYTRLVPVEGLDVLEIGPGQTLDVLHRAARAKARSCTALDVIEYVPAIRARESLITYRIYDGKQMPFEANSFDVIWSYTAFEHLRYPAVTAAECFRVLRGGGKLIALIDLGDHSCYGRTDPDPLGTFDCLRYPEWVWNLMKWNRSSYVNRLRKSDWQRLFAGMGFFCRHEESRISEDVARALPSLTYLRKYAYDDAVTSVLTVCLEKPSGTPGS